MPKSIQSVILAKRGYSIVLTGMMAYLAFWHYLVVSSCRITACCASFACTNKKIKKKNKMMKLNRYDNGYNMLKDSEEASQ